MNKTFNGDCLEVMDKLIADGVVVDAIIADIPYGTTACSWDSVIPFDEMWLRLNKLIKPNGAIVLFGSEPFSSALRMSNIKNFKYDWIWEKSKTQGFFNAKKMPLKSIEYISVFYNQLPTYNPQNTSKINMIKSNSGKDKKHESGQNGGVMKIKTYIQTTSNYPTQILKFNIDTGTHPTQKPLKLMEYLIRTYTNENELVLDFTFGSGTTLVACKAINRNYIGIELDKGYFDIANKRLENVQKALF